MTTTYSASELGTATLAAWMDDKGFARHFEPLKSWTGWMTVWRCLFGLELSADEREFFHRCTGRTVPLDGPLTEAWLICGRRSGKSRFLALVAVCLATFRDYGPFLAPGEQPLVMVLAKDRDQAGVIFGYAKALVTQTPMLASMLVRETSDTMELSNGVVIGVFTSNYKSVRGRTLACCLADEVAHWEGPDSRNPAEAILRALRPALSTIPGAMLLCASSTYTMDGALYDAFHKHHGKDTSNVLVWRAPTLTMNPSFRKEIVDAAYVAEAKDAAAEYGSEWLTDARAHFPEELIDAAIVPDRKSLSRDPAAEHVAFCDPSGGVSDSMTLAVAHIDSARMVVLDRLETVKPPFKPEDVCQRFADVLATYGLKDVAGDGFAKGWVKDAFRRVGITYMSSDLTKSEIYLAAQPLFTQRRIELLDIPVLSGELRRLERRARAGGRDQVDHPRGSHDDSANSACGALVRASKLQWMGRSAQQLLADSLPRTRGSLDYDPWDRGLGKPRSTTYDA
jgi:hypothetical protein